MRAGFTADCGEAQTAIRAGSGAGWFEGRVEFDSVGRRRRGQTIVACRVFDACDDALLRSHYGSVSEAMATMRTGGTGRCLPDFVRVGLRHREGHRVLVAVEAATAMK